ncbi:MAG: hypothetical protein HY314_14685 [Acidobacteria bacterium]|nr:hypothetical protein [Acidobacteriota bacterium]
MRNTEFEPAMTTGGPCLRGWLGLIVMTLLSSPLLPGSAKPEPDGQRRLDQILTGSFASGAPEEHDRSEFVLANWNIERGVRQTEILQALRDPLAADLYLLQEVDWQTRRTGYRNVAEEFARGLGMNYVFGIEFEELAQGRDGWPAFHGQVLLSRFPILRARVLRFRHQLYNWGPRWKPRWAWLQPRRGGRMALVVEFQWGGRPCVIYNVHLESKADEAGRAKQIREILDDIHAHYTPETPVIVAGDLNTKEGAHSTVLRELKAARFQDVLQGSPGSLQTKVRSNRRADWILVRHL